MSEQEQANTASQEIEVARRNIAKTVNKMLEDGDYGDKKLGRLYQLAEIIEMVGRVK